MTGVVFALAFAWINIGKIGGPNDHAESGSNTDDTATATARLAGTAGTDADTAAEDPSSAEPAKEMIQPDTTDDWLSHRKTRIAHTEIVMTSNGAGKSAWKRENYDRLPEHYFDQDLIADRICDWNSESARARTREYINDQINQATAAPRDFGIESTYSGRPGRAMVERAKAASYRVEGVYIGTDSPEINAERIDHRVKTNTGHHVDAERLPERYRSARGSLHVRGAAGTPKGESARRPPPDDEQPSRDVGLNVVATPST